MKHMLLAAMFAAAAAAAQGLEAEMPAARDILAKTDALKASAVSAKTINRELWLARAAYRAEPDPERRALLRARLDGALDTVLTAANKEIGAGSPAPAPLPPFAYDPREIRFEALLGGAEGKAIRVYHNDLRLATIRVGGALIGEQVVYRLIGCLEDSRRRAAALGRKVSIDEAAIELYNETGFLNRMALEEPGRFGAIVRITSEAVGG